MELQNNGEKDMTVNELASLMLKAFDSNQKYMDAKFDSMDQRFEQIEKKFDGKIDGINATIDAMDAKFEGEFKAVRYQLDKIETKLDKQEKTIFDHDGKIDKLEVDIKTVKKALALQN